MQILLVGGYPVLCGGDVKGRWRTLQRLLPRGRLGLLLQVVVVVNFVPLSHLVPARSGSYLTQKVAATDQSGIAAAVVAGRRFVPLAVSYWRWVESPFEHLSPADTGRLCHPGGDAAWSSPTRAACHYLVAPVFLAFFTMDLFLDSRYDDRWIIC
jgi:hypothetical protein